MKIVKSNDQKSDLADTPFEYNLWFGYSFASARNKWIEHWMAITKTNFDVKAGELRKNDQLISRLVDLYVEACKVSLIFYVLLQNLRKQNYIS